MSSRAIRRLEKKRLAEESAKDEVSSDESEVEAVSSRFNAFDLLNGEEESEEEEEESQQQHHIAPVSVSKPTTKSSKKKKNKAKASKQEELNSDEEFDRILEEAKRKDLELAKKGGDSVSASATPEVENFEDIYDFEEELDEDTASVPNYDSNFKHFTTKRLKKSLPLLSIGSVKNLDPDQELKNLFGNLSSEAIEDANTTTSLVTSPEVLLQFKRLARLTRGWGGKDRRSIPGSTRKLLLTRIRDDWLPTSQKPMNVEEIRREELIEYLDYKEDTVELEDLEVKVKKELGLGVKYFRFGKISNIQERVANTRFYASVVMTPDPDSLMQLLQQYPYHAETLLQVAMVFLRGENKSTSNPLVEKALFVFDRSIHKNMHELLLEGKTELIRLPYEGFLNRQFYLCLFRYISGLGERRTFFSALSYCKFLLALSPAEDPLGVRYFIDFYAIMSEEYQYLIKLAESPLCMTYDKWLTPGIAFSTVLAYLKLGDKEGAAKLLQVAFDRHPYAAYKLLELVGLAGSIPVQEADLPVGGDIIIAAETYLVRAGLLWNDQETRQFLHDNLTKLFAAKALGQDSGIKSSIYSFFGVNKSTKREDGDIPFNLIRFTILAGESKIMAKLPQEVWDRSDMFEYDVLPPRDAKVEYNEFTGVTKDNNSIVDSLLNYVDHNLLGTIIQNRTQDNDFQGILRQLQQEEPDDI